MYFVSRIVSDPRVPPDCVIQTLAATDYFRFVLELPFLVYRSNNTPVHSFCTDRVASFLPLSCNDGSASSVPLLCNKVVQVFRFLEVDSPL